MSGDAEERRGDEHDNTTAATQTGGSIEGGSWGTHDIRGPTGHINMRILQTPWFRECSPPPRP